MKLHEDFNDLGFIGRGSAAVALGDLLYMEKTINL